MPSCPAGRCCEVASKAESVAQAKPIPGLLGVAIVRAGPREPDRLPKSATNMTPDDTVIETANAIRITVNLALNPKKLPDVGQLWGIKAQPSNAGSVPISSANACYRPGIRAYSESV